MSQLSLPANISHSYPPLYPIFHRRVIFCHSTTFSFEVISLQYLSSSIFKKVFLNHSLSSTVTSLSFSPPLQPHPIITGDFNIHLGNPANTSQFLSLLSSFNLSQHVHFPKHGKNHILDLVITSSTAHLLRLFHAPIGLHPTSSCLHQPVYKPSTTSSSNTALSGGYTS